MARPRKCRRICRMPDNTGFTPVNRCPTSDRMVILNVDEYEAVRLIDKEGFSQEECGEYMKIARTTVQQIYGSARRKLADVLVDGLPLRIEGGDYILCDGQENFCRCSACHRRDPDCSIDKEEEERS